MKTEFDTIKKHFCTNANDDKIRSLKAKASGLALENHKRAVHKGEFDESCPACRELLTKIDRPVILKEQKNISIRLMNLKDLIAQIKVKD